MPFLAVLVCLAGCGEFSTDYGTSKGVQGRTSLNGFGGLRQAYQDAGFTTRDVSRLTDRVATSDVIVWTPKEYAGISVEATRWFENWLGQGGRTLVYVIPDSGSEVDYWRDAVSLAPPQQRLEYRKRAADAINRRFVWRLNRDTLPSNGWFSASPSVSVQDAADLSGPWAKLAAKESRQDTQRLDLDQAVAQRDLVAQRDSPARRDLSVTTELKLTPFAAAKPQPSVPPTPAVPFAPRGRASGPGSIGFSSSSVQPTKTEVFFRPRIKNANGETVVAVVGSKQWGSSKIVVVAGGSLLTNFALTGPVGWQLAKRLVQRSRHRPAGAETENPRAGFLTTDWHGVSVSQAKPGVPTASGMQWLTVWPINLVTMHGVMLGLVVCLMLLPIFGRPRRLRRISEGDFGDHLDAVAQLMRRAGGETYARQRISDYFRQVRQETSGPWVLPDTANHRSSKMPGRRPDAENSGQRNADP